MFDIGSSQKPHASPNWHGLTITITELGRAPTINHIYGNHWRARSRIVRDWRKTAAVLWRIELRKWIANQLGGGIAEPANRLTGATVMAFPLQSNRAHIQDTAACVPAVKATIDAATDIGLLIDDSPEHIETVTFKAPIVCQADGLTVTVMGKPI